MADAYLIVKDNGAEGLAIKRLSQAQFEAASGVGGLKNGLTAHVSDTMTAPANLVAGDYVMAAGTFYRVIQNVANGGTLTVNGNVVAADVGAELNKRANQNGTYDGLTAGNAKQLISTVGVTDKVPYNFRTSGGSADIGDREVDKIVGGTVAWNQLVNTGDTSVTVPSGHIYFANINGVQSVGASTGTAISVNDATEDNVFDLTQMFGTAIADYIYSLEQANAGAGVAWFRKLFPRPYYAYDAGSLQSVKAKSHVLVGFNAYNPTSGKAHVVGGNVYQITGTYTGLSLDGTTVTPDGNGKFTPSENGELTVTGGGSDTCVHLIWDGSRDGEYEPYTEHVYDLDPDLELRGIPKLDADSRLYYDGDVYESDGKVTRRYGEQHVDHSKNITMGEVSGKFRYFDIADPVSDVTAWEQNIFSNLFSPNLYGSSQTIRKLQYNVFKGPRVIVPLDDTIDTVDKLRTYLTSNPLVILYPLATPATETADAYHNPQIVDDFGTEEYVDAGVTASTPTRDVAIPVGHETVYQANLRAKLEMAPNSPDGDGDYIVRQAGGQNTYVPLTLPIDELPAAPTTDGTYTLKCTVLSGTPTFSWVS